MGVPPVLHTTPFLKFREDRESLSTRVGRPESQRPKAVDFSNTGAVLGSSSRSVIDEGAGSNIRAPKREQDARQKFQKDITNCYVGEHRLKI